MQFNLNLTQDELTDHINDLREGLGGELANRIAYDMELQRPGLSVPNNKQAVVRTAEGIWIRADDKSQSLAWMIAKDNGTYDWADEPRGKILEIIYPGQEA